MPRSRSTQRLLDACVSSRGCGGGGEEQRDMPRRCALRLIIAHEMMVEVVQRRRLTAGDGRRIGMGGKRKRLVQNGSLLRPLRPSASPPPHTSRPNQLMSFLLQIVLSAHHSLRHLSLFVLHSTSQAPANPGSIAARNDSTGSFFNPCGKFTCIAKGKTNECDCNDPRRWLSHMRLQATLFPHFSPSSSLPPLPTPPLPSPLSTAPSSEDACKAAQRNPCAISHIPSLSASPCASQGDTCEGIAGYFGVDFQALNPSLDCSANGGLLQPEQAVCVERMSDQVGLIPVCSQYYLVQSAETCESICNVPFPPLSPVDFFRLNPGIKCNRLIPNTDVGSFTGFEVRVWQWLCLCIFALAC
ncbi:unnamed protein product [Closterium sp. NIES-54]